MSLSLSPLTSTRTEEVRESSSQAVKYLCRVFIIATLEEEVDKGRKEVGFDREEKVLGVCDYLYGNRERREKE